MFTYLHTQMPSLLNETKKQYLEPMGLKLGLIHTNRIYTDMLFIQ